MADISGLVKALKDKAVAQYDKGAPYRQALVSALRGDTQGINQALSKSDLTPMDFATTFAPLGITAWHGSPHSFDKFDINKVNSGSGTQNYGWGLYFAGNPKGAETFQSRAKGPSGTASNYLKKYENPENAISALESQLNSSLTDLGKQHTQEAIDLIKSGKITSGNMYKVDIADESIPKMLDWYEQVPEELRSSLSKKAMNEWDSGLSGSSGKDLYKALEKNFEWAGSKTPDKDASNWLLQNGVPGVKYPAPGVSGAEGINSNNYVVFDPTLLKILQKK